MPVTSPTSNRFHYRARFHNSHACVGNLRNSGCENCISFKIRNSAHSFRSVKLHAVLQHIALCGGIKESFEAVFSFLIEFGEVKLMLISYKLD